MDWLILACRDVKPAKKARLSCRHREKKGKGKSKGKKKNIFSDPATTKPMKVYAPHNQVFNIFPSNTFPKKIEAILAFMKGITLKDRQIYVRNFLKNPHFNPIDKKLYETSMNTFWTGSSSGQTIEILLKAHIKIIVCLRACFRRFLHIWRSTRLQAINTEDIVTMEVPKDPIYIVDWTGKNPSKSVFESSTLMRDITLRLLHHDGFFDCSQEPRNPYTNLPLTQGQLISVWIQLARSKATASSAFTGFRQVRWDLYKYVVEYALQLQLHAFRTTMRNPMHPDYKDRMSDFIHFCYDQEDVEYPKSVFDNALVKSPSHRLLKQWSELCILYYEATYIFGKSPYKIVKIQEDVLDKSIFLIRRHKELNAISPM